MLMRINNHNLTGASAAETNRTLETHVSDGAAGASPNGIKRDGDRVELSTTLGRVSRVLSADGADHAARVQALEVQYQSGRYRVDSMATSRAMVAETMAASPK